MTAHSGRYYDPTPKRIERLYKQTVDEILDFMVKELSVETLGTPAVVNQAAIMRQVQIELYKYNPEIRAEVEKAILNSFKDGQAHTLLTIGEAETFADARRGVTQSLFQKRKVESIFQDTFSDLLYATNNTDVRLKRIIRETAADRVQLGVARQMGWKQVSNDLEKRLVKEGLSKTIKTDGFVGVVDKAGRRWQLETYTDMLVETKMRDAYIEGVRTEGLEFGTDLAIISGHGAKDACGQWEGVIISMNGMTEGLPTYDDALGSGQVFHPRCQHHLMPYRSMDLIHPNAIAKSEKATKALNL